jgi:hypothetical protein
MKPQEMKGFQKSSIERSLKRSGRKIGSPCTGWKREALDVTKGMCNYN